MSSPIRYRSLDRRFLEPNLSHEFRKFAIQMFGALCIGLILAPAILAWAGGAR